MLINGVDPEQMRVAIVADSELEEFYLESLIYASSKGNVYKGVIRQLKPALQAAFVDIGSRKNGFLQLDEIHPEYFKKERGWQRKDSKIPITELLKPGQEVLVQVVKEETHLKGAYLSTFLSLPGRYLVLMPGKPHSGVSRKIEDDKLRRRLKDMAKSLKPPEGVGVIVRTAGQNVTKRDMQRDFKYLLRMWGSVKADAKGAAAPSIIYQEMDLAMRVVRDSFSPDVETILVDDQEVYNRVRDFLGLISPRYKSRVKHYQGKRPIFGKYDLEEKIKAIYDKNVKLPSGGRIVLEQTEAMVTIDVNSGGAVRDKGLMETSFHTNLEAAKEAPRQLRLRDLGGLVVIDFIEMRDKKHIREVVRTLKAELRKDRAKTLAGPLDRFGTLTLSRQRLRPTLQQSSFVDCPTCAGTGMVFSVRAAALDFLREVRLLISRGKAAKIHAKLPQEVASHILNFKRAQILELEEGNRVEVVVEGSREMSWSKREIVVTKKEEPAPAPKEEPKKAAPEKKPKKSRSRPRRGRRRKKPREGEPEKKEET